MSTDLDLLRTADRESAAAFFAAAPAEGLVAAVAATPDDRLVELLGRPQVRAAAVTGILRRLDEYADPARLADLKGSVRFELTTSDGGVETRGLSFADGVIEPLVEASALGADPAGADVVLRSTLLRFARLVTGQGNAALDHLAGHLEVEGDAMLALGVGGLFRVPGHDEVAVDLTALDPVEVATAVAEASTDHLRSVMAGGFRPVVLDEVFRRLPDFVDARRSSRLRVAVGFRLAASGDLPADRYLVRIDRGHTTVERTETGDDGRDGRDATIVCEAHDFLRLATGQLSVMTGLLRGQLKVRGDRAKALQLAGAIDFPRAAPQRARR
ncbi:MAG: SCP2 sterol-binding domain-containing protein [Nocardioides sp.]|nr:SCP2 sterol-binding domain-containing protein [Nocardioides sp.]